MTARTLRDLPKDLDKQISRDFNALIKKVHRTLSTKNIVLFIQDFLLLVGKFKVVQ